MANEFVIDTELVLRFAAAMMPIQPHLAETLVRSVRTRSAISTVKSVQMLWRSVGFAGGETLEAEFSRGELLYLAQLAEADPERIAWSQGAARQRRRQEALNEASQRLGFKTWRRLETAVVNGDVRLKLER
jgi:hypothetical protein